MARGPLSRQETSNRPACLYRKILASAPDSLEWPVPSAQTSVRKNACFSAAPGRSSRPAFAQEIRELAAARWTGTICLPRPPNIRFGPLLARHLSALRRGGRSASSAEAPDRCRPHKHGRCLILTAELIRIMDRFHEAGIPAVPYKGPVIAVQAYETSRFASSRISISSCRSATCCAQTKSSSASAIARGSPGFSRPTPRPRSCPANINYRDEARRILLELHTERTLRHFPVPPDLDDLARSLVPLSFSGHEIRTFAPEDALVMLCIHGSKDFWQKISWVVGHRGVGSSVPGAGLGRRLPSSGFLERAAHPSSRTGALACDMLDARLPG